MPEKDILALVCGSVWNKIIGMKQFAPPPKLWLEWKREANKQAQDSKESRAIVEQLKSAYWAPELPEQLWEKLWLDEIKEDTWALVKHPIDESYVKQPKSRNGQEL